MNYADKNHANINKQIHTFFVHIQAPWSFFASLCKSSSTSWGVEAELVTMRMPPASKLNFAQCKTRVPTGHGLRQNCVSHTRQPSDCGAPGELPRATREVWFRAAAACCSFQWCHTFVPQNDTRSTCKRQIVEDPPRWQALPMGTNPSQWSWCLATFEPQSPRDSKRE